MCRGGEELCSHAGVGMCVGRGNPHGRLSWRQGLLARGAQPWGRRKKRRNRRGGGEGEGGKVNIEYEEVLYSTTIYSDIPIIIIQQYVHNYNILNIQWYADNAYIGNRWLLYNMTNIILFINYYYI